MKKSEILLGKRCNKALWIKHNNSDNYQAQYNTKSNEIEEIEKLAKSIIIQGKDINEVAHEEKEVATEELMAKGINIYNASFKLEEISIKCNMIEQKDNGHVIYLVKSSTKLKDEYIDDAAIQYWVLNELKYKITGVNIVYINKEYIRNGDINIQELFTVEDITNKVIEHQLQISQVISKSKEIIDEKNEPEISIGLQCLEDIGCPCKTYCWKDIPVPSLFDISGTYMKKNKKIELYNDGVVSFKQLESVKKLSDNVKIQIRAELYNEEIVNKEAIASILKEWAYPLYFLDFESYMTAVPLYDNTKPYQQLPFQYSLHIVDESKEIVHKEFLAEVGNSPLRLFAESLINVLDTEGSVIVYNKTFEMTRIKELAKLFPDLSDKLLAINERIKDLMEPFQKKYYYNKAMHGDYSIKYVLPALFPDEDELDYKKLEIGNGQMAMNAYATLHLKSNEEQEEIKEALLKYCCLDTWAMVKIWERLSSM